MADGARDRLTAARDEAAAQADALRRDLTGIIDAAADSATDDEHDPEGSTIAFERAQTAALLAGARQLVADLDRALDRLASGDYGSCARCGDVIPAERLAARPAATTCVRCAR